MRNCLVVRLLPLLLAFAAPGEARPLPRAKPKPAERLPVLQSIQVQPNQATLYGSRDERRMLVTGRFSDGVERDLTEVATYASAAPATARVAPGGTVSPGTTDGTARVKVSVGRFSVSSVVTVKAAALPVSFLNEVIPVLTKAGCNQGACHGAQHGKGGFKLSLLGYDPQADHLTIVRQSEGRRVQLAAPDGSLLLTKPILGVAHAGGRRFERGSYEYRVLREWLENGAPPARNDEPAVTRLEAVPAQRIVNASAADPTAPAAVVLPQVGGAPRIVRLPAMQRLAAIATFKDGRTEDVSRKVQFNSLNAGVAEVEPTGQVTLAGKGETAIMLRYRGQATVARITVPYRALPTSAAPTGFTQRNYIDELVAKKWREMGLTPSAPASDAEFLRRVYQDVLGMLPTPEEARAFLADTAPDRRAKLVDAVLARPEYVDYWTLKWGDLLRNNRDKLGEKGMWSFYNWLRASFRDNKPMNRFAEELITAQGSTFTSGPANYFRVAGDASQQAEVTSQVFLGVRLACAKCHHHPFEKWSQDDYWQMAAFFARVGLKGSNEFGLFGGEQVVRLGTGGEVANPRTGQTMKPTPLDGVPADDPSDRRRPLAKWLTAPENPFFARNLVNRYWGYLLGRGIVEPVDDLRVTNPPSNPALLDALAKDFVEHGYDVKHLLRAILNSSVYQLGPTPTPANRHDEVFQTKYAVKRMGAETLMDALNFATGATDKFPNLPAGMRAVQLPDPKIDNYFLETFGRPGRELVCECERSAEPNMAQALHLMNSDFVQNKVGAEGGRIAKLLEAKKSDSEIVEELYLVAYGRFPTPEERARAELSIATAPERKEGLEDLLWALLNSREFLFIH